MDRVMAGNRPFNSHAAKKNVQSMNGSELAEGHLEQPPAGKGRRQRQRGPVGLEPAFFNAAQYDSSGRSRRALYCSPERPC
mgnify:CR=1 FL=1